MGKKHLTFEERFYIEKRITEGASVKEIAQGIGFHVSTIRRELKRNTDAEFGVYNNRRAETMRLERYQQGRSPAQSLIVGDMETFILGRLLLHDSPKVISGRLWRTDGIKLSKNTLYRWIDKQSLNGLPLHEHLPHAGKMYTKSGAKLMDIKISGRVSIAERPPIADQKIEVGHGEADTIFGKNQESFVLSVADKCTRWVAFRKLPNKQADTVNKAFRDITASTMIVFKTMTSDNGTEFAGHQEISAITGADFYFADPYSSWQRGLNEHINGLFRRFFPKGTDFNLVTDEEIARVEHIINTRPRAVLGFKTPNEVLLEHLMAA